MVLVVAGGYVGEKQCFWGGRIGGELDGKASSLDF
jgi:hypothetical protein